MTNDNKIRGLPSGFPGVGNVGQQPPKIDITQAIQTICPNCKGELFDRAVRVGIVSHLAPGNDTGQDVTVETAVHVCRSCGDELRKVLPEAN